jgi:hypothetical protein
MIGAVIQQPVVGENPSFAVTVATVGLDIALCPAAALGIGQQPS